jgi:hypothetical protein
MEGPSMLKTIILLTNTVQQQQPLANLLRTHNAGLAFCSALRAEHLAALEPEVLDHARLVSFANDVGVPEKLLLRFGYGAYKFHVAPVQYPGLPPTPDENEEDARCISAIAQSMTIWPDFRKVVGLETITIPEGTAPAERQRLAFSRLAHLFWRMSGVIAGDTTELRGVSDSDECQQPPFATVN